jgi:hypothetical protein
MSVKLTDAQLVMMSAAAQREDRCLTALATMKGAVLGKVSEKLIKVGFVREIVAKAGMPVWRRDEVGKELALKLSAAGKPSPSTMTPNGQSSKWSRRNRSRPPRRRLALAQATSASTPIQSPLHRGAS